MLIFAVLAVVIVLAFSATLYRAGGRGRNGIPRWQPLCLGLLAPLAVVLLYAVRGMPQAVNLPSPQAAGNAAGAGIDPNVMVQKLANRLKDHPEDMDGWLMLARSYTALNRYAEAADAYEHAQTKVMQNKDLLVRWIELRLEIGGGKPDTRTHELIGRAATLEPNDPEVLLLRTLAAFDRGDKTAAEALVSQLHDLYPPNHPDRAGLDAMFDKWRSQSGASMGQEAQNPPPSTPNAAGGAPDPNVMVQRLADRLKEHPEDTQGWLMLARSYAVLNRYADAALAYEHAQAKVMQDKDLLTSWIGVRLLSAQKFDARTRTLLDRAIALAPDEPAVLMLRAMEAIDRSDTASADAIINQLHARFPSGSADRQYLDAAISGWQHSRSPAAKSGVLPPQKPVQNAAGATTSPSRN
jgi:cytochrome c-type biogenesis protein CcmH